MPQTTYSNRPSARYPGMPVDGGASDDISKILSTNQLSNVLVVNAVNDAVYSITITDGEGATDQAEFTADGSATKAEIVAGLVAAVDALGLAVDATSVDADEFTIESTSENGGFTATSDGDTASDLTITALVAQDQEAAFGVALCLDENRGDNYARAPRLSADVALCWGIALRDSAKQPNAGGHAAQAPVKLRNKGRVAVICEDAFSVGDGVYVRYASGSGGSTLGAIRTDGDSSSAAALSRAKFVTSGSAGEIAIIELS